MSRLIIAVSVLFFLLLGPLHAQDSGGFAGDHMLNKLKIQNCRLTYALGPDAFREFLKCKSEAGDQLSATHKRMLAKLKSSSQRSAVKEYRVAMGLALEGSEPKENELKFQYEARLARLDEDVERAWLRLTVE